MRLSLTFTTLLLACTVRAPLRAPFDDRSTLVRSIEDSDVVLLGTLTSNESAVGFSRAKVSVKVNRAALGTAPEELEIEFHRASNTALPAETGRIHLFFLRRPESTGGAWRALGKGPGVPVRDGVLVTGETVDRVFDLVKQEEKMRTRFTAEARDTAAGKLELERLRIVFMWPDANRHPSELGMDGSGRITSVRDARIDETTVDPSRLRAIVDELATLDFAARQRQAPNTEAPGDVLTAISLGTGAQRFKRLPASELAALPLLSALFEEARQALHLPPPQR